MEHFTVAHSGTIQHVHSILLPQSAAEVAREVRIAVTVLVAAWATVKAMQIFGPQRQETKHHRD